MCLLRVLTECQNFFYDLRDLLMHVLDSFTTGRLTLKSKIAAMLQLKYV